MPKSQLDWLAVVGLWIGAVVMAIRAGGLPLMGGAPTWLASHLWGYVPFVLVTFYITVALFRLRAPVAQAAASVPSKPKIPERDDRPEQREFPKVPGRVILPRKITPEYLFNLREGKTDIQLTRVLTPYLGKWIYVSGVVQDVARGPNSGHIHITLKGLSQIASLDKMITARFDSDLDRLEMYEMADEVMVCGCLHSVGALGMQLVHCELVD